ncbi:type II toxin-antitoxin system VapC family toxin [Cyanobium sp. Morenito 9A2]|uniref:type II toxin-antitoxin system VapC family toxin n=1 Tax=Cyanobium sp. Morenito 9A2 TaxID=2823718 RepID=UPI0020CF7617|nr:type II toxin-antitoxin system VapC family toxin [Cyanobium sp. Morenito 9A2]MCP9848937.1 type II toxin-antitoxin system VapC family toxin [Cyanobium sp. Morenito 9A2]
MIVVDASAVVAGLLNAGPARTALAMEALQAPHLLDGEVASVLRRLCRTGELQVVGAEHLLLVFSALGIRRHASAPLLGRIWALRDNLSAYDASYVALAETLGCPLLTADRRLAAAPGPTCGITLLAAAPP